jgi:hypothetical protein
LFGGALLGCGGPLGAKAGGKDILRARRQAATAAGRCAWKGRARGGGGGLGPRAPHAAPSGRRADEGDWPGWGLLAAVLRRSGDGFRPGGAGPLPRAVKGTSARLGMAPLCAQGRSPVDPAVLWGSGLVGAEAGQQTSVHVCRCFRRARTRGPAKTAPCDEASAPAPAARAQPSPRTSGLTGAPSRACAGPGVAGRASVSQSGWALRNGEGGLHLHELQARAAARFKF